MSTTESSAPHEMMIDLVSFGWFLSNAGADRSFHHYWSLLDRQSNGYINMEDARLLIQELLYEYLKQHYTTPRVDLHPDDVSHAVEQVINVVNSNLIDEDAFVVPDTGMDASVLGNKDKKFGFDDFCSLGRWLVEIEKDSIGPQGVSPSPQPSSSVPLSPRDLIVQTVSGNKYKQFLTYVKENKEYVWNTVISKNIQKINKARSKPSNKHISYTSFPEHRFLFVMRHCFMDYIVRKLNKRSSDIDKGAVERLCDEMCGLFLSQRDAGTPPSDKPQLNEDSSSSSISGGAVRKSEFFMFLNNVPRLIDQRGNGL